MQNTGILKKCLEELSKESPRLDYVRGMLETLIDVSAIPDGAFLQADGNGKVRVTTNEQEIRKVLMDTPLPPVPDLIKIKAIAEQSL